MTIRVLNETRDTALAEARADGDALWLASADVERATGWSWKPQGLCRADTCRPLPRGGARPMVDGDRLDVAAFWRYSGSPVAHADAGDLWVLGEGAAQRAEALTAEVVPDVELPDLDGRPHRLSDYRGKRVFVTAWASW